MLTKPWEILGFQLPFPSTGAKTKISVAINQPFGTPECLKPKRQAATTPPKNTLWAIFWTCFSTRFLPLRGSGYLGYVDSNQGYNNLFKWVKNVPKSLGYKPIYTMLHPVSWTSKQKIIPMNRGKEISPEPLEILLQECHFALAGMYTPVI